MFEERHPKIKTLSKLEKKEKEYNVSLVDPQRQSLMGIHTSYLLKFGQQHLCHIVKKHESIHLQQFVV